MLHSFHRQYYKNNTIPSDTSIMKALMLPQPSNIDGGLIEIEELVGGPQRLIPRDETYKWHYEPLSGASPPYQTNTQPGAFLFLSYRQEYRLLHGVIVIT
ncbi:hypothetical protein TWF481_011522 [Arthrobotrys musiformis]|uniref:Uncharacterized protein n=1 Tax=Arthrobotrys musiformis TaxID=47236 RepID=A0AAV9W1J1_9PEZI